MVDRLLLGKRSHDDESDVFYNSNKYYAEQTFVIVTMIPYITQVKWVLHTLFIVCETSYLKTQAASVVCHTLNLY